MKVKKFTIEVISDENGLKMNRVNDGFTFYELVGLLKIIELDFYDMAKGIHKDIEIKRTVIENENI